MQMKRIFLLALFFIFSAGIEFAVRYFFKDADLFARWKVGQAG